MITFSGVPANARATARYIESQNIATSVAGLVAPRKILAFGQFNGNKSPVVNVPKQIFSEQETWDLYGRGSMLARIAKGIFDGNKTQTEVFLVPLADIGAGVKATGQITVTGTATESGSLSFLSGGQKITVAVANTATGEAVTEAVSDAITAKLDLPIVSTFTTPNAVLEARNKGLYGNSIFIETSTDNGDKVPSGLTVTITAMASGTTNPDISLGFPNLGDDFYTDVIVPYKDSTNTNALTALGNTRYAPDIKKPIAGFVPNTQGLSDFITTANGLNSQWITLIPTFASNTWEVEILAETAGIFSRANQARPGVPITTESVSCYRVPSGFVNFTTGVANQIVSAGGSWYRKTPDNRMVIMDLVTTRKTNDLGAIELDFQFTETLANLQTKIFSQDQVFSRNPFIQAVVVDDNSVTTVDYAIRPKTVKAFLVQLIDELFLARALSKQRDDIIASIEAEIDPGNGGRINIRWTDYIASGLKIIAVKYNWTI